MLSMQYEEAANKFKEALELEENSYSYFGIGYSMIQLAQLEVAEESLQNAVRVDQNNEVAWYFLGEVYNKQEQLVLATESYQNSINVNPEYANPYLGLGVLLVNSGNQQDDENLKVEGCSYISEAANLGLSVAVQVLELSCSEQE